MQNQHRKEIHKDKEKKKKAGDNIINSPTTKQIPTYKNWEVI